MVYGWEIGDGDGVGGGIEDEYFVEDDNIFWILELYGCE